jgi:hypothetical protein
MRLHLTCVERRILDEIASSICARTAAACDVRSAPNRSGRYDYGAGIPTPGRLNRDAECKYRRRWLASPVAESSRRSPSSLSPATIMTWTATICSGYIGPNSIDQAVAIARTSMYRLRQRSWRAKPPCNNCRATELLASVHLPELSKKRGSWGRCDLPGKKHRIENRGRICRYGSGTTLSLGRKPWGKTQPHPGMQPLICHRDGRGWRRSLGTKANTKWASTLTTCRSMCSNTSKGCGRAGHPYFPRPNYFVHLYHRCLNA